MRHLMYTFLLFSFILGCIATENGIIENGTFKDLWGKVKQLQEDHKYKKALEVVKKIHKLAIQEKNEKQETKALVRIVLLQRGLHGNEKAVRFLLKTKWPKAKKEKALLHIFFANTLYDYYLRYSWEINQREKVASKKGVDIKKWTAYEIFKEIHKQYALAYKEKQILGKLRVNQYKEYIKRNGYPEHIRSTMRDFVVYQWVEFLGNTNTWRPEQLREKYLVDFNKLAMQPEKRKVVDPQTFLARKLHPVEKMVYILDLLYKWHKKERPESALESQLERIKKLSNIFSKVEKKDILITKLKELLKSFRNKSWWATGQYELAMLVKSKGEFVQAHKIASAAYAKYPESLGGSRCFYLIKELEAPSYSIQTMSVDKLKAPSIKITHNNIKTLYFRAYKLNFKKWASRKHRYLGSVYSNDLRNIIHNTLPEVSWKVDLEDLKDYKSHITYNTPQVKKKGFYIISASLKENFATYANQILGTYMIFSDYVVIKNNYKGVWEVRVLHAKTGVPIPTALVQLYKYDYSRGSSIIDAKRTDEEGLVLFRYKPGRSSCFVVAEKNDQISFDPNAIYFSNYKKYNREQKGCFIYTDRSIYRPLQKLHFKVVTYRGKSKKGYYRCIPNKKIKVTFSDPNGKLIKKMYVQTNTYGTASGTFDIPKGRVLGRYNLRARISAGSYGNSSIRVEEYKRPTFEATLKKPKTSLRINEKISVTGEAKYYFGLPVTTGNVSYRVTRQTVWPWWYWWYYGGGSNTKNTYEIASGKTNLKEDGTFEVNFIPKGDPSIKKDSGVSYNFLVDVDITDEGGETRSTSYSYKIGYVAIRANCQLSHNFYLTNENTLLTINRTDLSGVGREGEGKYKLYKIKQPKKVFTPDKFISQFIHGKHTEGDTMKPRWEADKTLQRYLFFFKDGSLVKQGKTTHDKNGATHLSLGKLQAGAYRLRYTTKDRWGSEYKTQKDFLVAANGMKCSIPFVMLARKQHLKVGEKALFLYGSSLEKQNYWFEIYQSHSRMKQEFKENGGTLSLRTYDIKEEHRGGFSVRIHGVFDYRLYQKSQSIYVPWNNKQLKISFTRFRNLLRPGQKETWTVSIKGPDSQAAASEVLAYMYDRSLDFFTPHSYPNIGELYPRKFGMPSFSSNIAQKYFSYVFSRNIYKLPKYKHYSPDRFFILDSYPIGGLGRRRHYGAVKPTMMIADEDSSAVPEPEEAPQPVEKSAVKFKQAPGKVARKKREGPIKQKQKSGKKKNIQIRTNFNETAFFKPHLVSNKKGEVKITFQVPDSVTSWNVYLHAITKELHFMSLKKSVVTQKDMMVRPYMPRFFREGDEAFLKVVINNATKKTLSGNVILRIIDPKTKQDKTKEFAIKNLKAKTWEAKGKRSANVTWYLKAPHKLGVYAFKVVATTKDFSDGELRPLPVLPSRVHLTQSKFVTLKDNETRYLHLKDMETSHLDKSLIHQSLVVTLNAQLIYTVLKALPYLVEYPHECVEQTLNRFISTGIVSSLYDQYPAIAKMAKVFSKRQTRLDPWRKIDANRKMALEETPWLQTAEGGKEEADKLINILDRKIAQAHKNMALSKLKKAQISNGAFPWWAGGPPSPYITLYVMHGFAKTREFKVDIPKKMVQKAWVYLAGYFRDYYAKKMRKEDYGYSFITFLNYVLSCYKDPSYYKGSFTEEERKEMLEFSFKHWRKHSPFLKAYLSLTLKRMGRDSDAILVIESIMDSAVTKKDQGTFWAPEDRGWLWYNDTIESHAFILRALQEVKPKAKKHIDGLVLWLLLNKKMNQWKSTRTTAEVVYSLVYTMHKQKSLAVKESAKVQIGNRKETFTFEPDVYTGGQTQVIVKGDNIQAKAMSKVEVEKKGKGYMFASMTWHYSTEKLPKESRGDFLSVTRKYYLRVHQGKEYVLKPIAEGAQIKVGDQVEVHLSIRAKHPMEYVHLRDPRGAGFEPTKNISGHHWDLGIYWYEETKDSGTNFFFEKLPQGEYNFKYRIRATMAGTFRVGPATIQSMYAPDFAGFSSGAKLQIK